MAARQADFKGWVLWLQWLAANVVGRGVAAFVSLHLLSSVSDLRDQILPNAVVGALGAYVPLGFLFGLGLGTAQWLVLRKKLHSIRVWIWASAISWALGGVAGAVVDLYECPPGACGTLDWAYSLIVGLCAIGVAGGLIFGATQWLILRRRVRRAGWWLLIAVGEATPWLFTWLFYGQIYAQSEPTPQLETAQALWVASLVLWAIAYAVLPGILLVWLLRHSIPQRGDLW